MKTIFLGILILVLPMFANAQDTTPTEDPEVYLKKSIRQKKTGNIFLLAGSGLFLAGGIGYLSVDESNMWSGLDKGVAGGVMVAGLVTAGSSYFFYRASRKNKEKYDQLKPEFGFVTEKISRTKIPAVGVSYNF